MKFYSTTAPCLAALLVVISSTGCVAMNIPSKRLYDGDDCGGLLGSWQAKSAQQQSCESLGAEGQHGDDLLGGICLDGGPLTDDFSDDDFQAEPTAADPVPWPRFHPIPTRPAFSPATVGHGPY